MVRTVLCVLVGSALSLAATPALSTSAPAQTSPASAPLPAGVRAVWQESKAWHETTPTREKICLNGLWRWRPTYTRPGDSFPEFGGPTNPTPPRTGWGWFKVPGPWPGIQDYMQKDCQSVIANDAWSSLDLSKISQAWYERDFTIPRDWDGRRIGVQASYVNSVAECFVDRKPVGKILFPAGEVDLTGKVGPGRHTLAILVAALPLKAVLQSYANTNTSVPVEGSVPRRGLCGDVFLTSTPKNQRITSAWIETNFQKGFIQLRGELAGITVTPHCRLQAEILDGDRVVKTFGSPVYLNGAAPSRPKPLPTGPVDDLPYYFKTDWRPDKLWDTDTPQNQYTLRLSLLDENDKLLDQTAPVKFGYRQFWIDGRDFYLNGSRIFLDEVPLENAGISAGLASYEGAKETLRRLKEIGVNMVSMHNYDCNPGDYLSFDEILRAADDTGMLVAITMPHFGDYDWSTRMSDSQNGYLRDAAFIAGVAGNHPSVILYATSHNATGYNEDTKPDAIDGTPASRDDWASNNVRLAQRAETLIRTVDPTRIVYHHSGGSLGSIYTVNFYLNFVPPQELDEWFGHWAMEGIKPLFLVEYGVPFSWDWTMYRGWYNGQRHFGEAQAPWEYCMAEWNAQFLGDEAYRISEAEKRNLRWEAPMFRENKVWYRWDYPLPPGTVDPGFEDQQRVWAEYTAENWRAFRTWGVSGISPWEICGTFWGLKPGVNRGRVELKADWDNLQRPGYSPDFVDGRYERRDTAYQASDWIPTTGGKALLRNNMPCLAYIAGPAGPENGKDANFTSKDHIFRSGEKVEKQIALINNSRRTVSCDVKWRVDVAGAPVAEKRLDLPPGEIRFLPIEFPLASSIAAGEHTIRMSCDFGPQGRQEDEFKFTVVPKTPPVLKLSKLAIYDPAGETTKLLASLGVKGTAVGPNDDLSAYSTVIIGKKALAVTGPGPNLRHVRDGQVVLVFEQTADVLEQRLGFRVEEYGLRNVFPRVTNSPVLAGLDAKLLRDWRGSATLIPPTLTYQPAPQFYGAPSVVRNGMVEPRVWRCGTRGTVADVIIEKPARGDFLPILDGGFSLEYSPLLEYREGKGMVLFCQMDVTGRTQTEPAAERLVSNLLNYARSWKAGIERQVVYVGDEAGRAHLRASGIAANPYDGVWPKNGLLVLGPGFDQIGEKLLDRLRREHGAGSNLALAIGLKGDQVNRVLSNASPTLPGEYIEPGPIPRDGVFDGIGPAGVYSHAPVHIPLLTSGCPVLGLAGTLSGASLIQFQLVPWSFDVGHQNTKRTFRRTSQTLSRLLGNLGVHGETDLLSSIQGGQQAQTRIRIHGFYLDTPADFDDPYRFFGW